MLSQMLQSYPFYDCVIFHPTNYISMFNRLMWLVAAALGSTDLKHFHDHRNSMDSAVEYNVEWVTDFKGMIMGQFVRSV